MIRQCAVNKHKKPLQKVCLSFIVVSFKDAIISYFFGSHTVILVPIPSLERFSKCPRCLSTIHLAMDNPSPVLPVLLFLTSSEQKNRSKICATFCSCIRSNRLFNARSAPARLHTIKNLIVFHCKFLSQWIVL